MAHKLGAIGSYDAVVVPVKVLKSMLKSGLIRFEPPPMPAAHAQALA